MPKSKQPTEARYALRLPDDLYKQIQELADRENRSVNAQIVTLLQDELALRRTLDAQREPGDLIKHTPPAG